MHDIDDQDSNVAKRGTTASEVRERLVSRSVDDKETRDFELEFTIWVHWCDLLLQRRRWEIRSANLLCDATSFAFLDIGLSNLVEKLSLAGIDVAEDTANGRSEIVL
jgi:hypothetical protein